MHAIRYYWLSFIKNATNYFNLANDDPDLREIYKLFPIFEKADKKFMELKESYFNKINVTEDPNGNAFHEILLCPKNKKAKDYLARLQRVYVISLQHRAERNQVMIEPFSNILCSEFHSMQDRIASEIKERCNYLSKSHGIYKFPRRFSQFYMREDVKLK